MGAAPRRHQAIPPTELREDVGESGPGRILLGVFEVLDRAGVPYCVLHGYENYPQRIESDVDCMISAEVNPGQLLALLHKCSTRIGADVVWSRAYHLVLAGKNANGLPCFLELDMSVDYELDDRPFYAGREVLESRRRHRQFWIPTASLEFSCYLVKKIAKERLDNEQARRLSSLYQEDTAGCARQVARFWGARNTALIISAARSGDWEPVRRRLGELRAELHRRATLRNPGRVVGNKLYGLASRMRRCWRPDGGLDIVFLGPDGAGKSSVIQALGQRLAPAFGRTTCHSFPPGLLDRLLHRPDQPDVLPHAWPPRSFLASVTRAIFYWSVYYTFGYVIVVHFALVRSALVLHDRHLVDALVDPRRYRYGGPLWLLRLIWRLVPKPDLIILLDAPPGVLQARKQEVPFEETARQREAYISLVRPMKNGHVVDAARPFEHVVGDVSEIILRHLAARITALAWNQTCATQLGAARHDDRTRPQ
jgi:thymidylate kinase